MQFAIKTIVSALIIAFVSTISKKYPTVGAITVSLPLTSMLALVWLFRETKDVGNVIKLSNSIIWIVIPSVVFFIALIFFLKKNINFYLSMAYSSAVMAAAYYLYTIILKKIGIQM